MRQFSYLRSFVLCSCAAVVCAGCSSHPGTTSNLGGAPPAVASPVATPPVSPVPLNITKPSIYVTQYDWSPWSVMIFPITDSGWAEPPVEIPGSQVSVDGAGNIYVVVQENHSPYKATSINVYAPDSPSGIPVRSLPVGPGTKISALSRMIASATGEIFVSDGVGIAVFSSTATGDADPVRYILGNSQPGGGASTAIVPGYSIAVDSSDNLYVLNKSDSSIVVFGPTATGNAVPSRTISGLLTQVSSPNYTDMTTDNLGNLYVLCYCVKTTGLNAYGVLEFAPDANGNVAPIRYVTTPGLDTEYEGTGVAVDSAGTIYFMASRVLSQGAVFEFPSTASGSVTPDKTLTYSTWWESVGTMAVH